MPKQTVAADLRAPSAEDGQRVYDSLKRWGGLDPNSPYAYLLFCDRFASHCAIAEQGDEIVGFVIGMPLTDTPDTLFVWQVGVDPRTRGQRVAGRMIEHILKRVGVRFLEAHVGEQNAASEALFCGIGKRHGAPVEQKVAYPAQWFPEGHDTERLLRIGPFTEI